MGAGPGAVIELAAPVSGAVVALTAVADPVFASGTLGRGLGIVPTEGRVHAPCAGVVTAAVRSGHALGLRSADGVEVLLHVGIDTVELHGRHFRVHTAKGRPVARGDLLVEFDLAAVKAAGYDPTTILVVANTASFARVVPTEVAVIARGETAVVVER